jgi:hypothetical protein
VEDESRNAPSPEAKPGVSLRWRRRGGAAGTSGHSASAPAPGTWRRFLGFGGDLRREARVQGVRSTVYKATPLILGSRAPDGRPAGDLGRTGAGLLLRGGDGAAMWGRCVGERGKRLRERPRDRAEELTSGPGAVGTERAGEARAGRRGCGSGPSERASGRDGPARGGRPREGKAVGKSGPRERADRASIRESWAARTGLLGFGPGSKLGWVF